MPKREIAQVRVSVVPNICVGVSGRGGVTLFIIPRGTIPWVDLTDTIGSIFLQYIWCVIKC